MKRWIIAFLFLILITTAMCAPLAYYQDKMMNEPKELTGTLVL